MHKLLLPAASLALLSTLPTASIHAKPILGPINPAARCAAFWSGMTRAAPAGSPAHDQMTERKNQWLALAVTQIGESEAKRILNANGPALGQQVRDFAGDSDAMQGFAAAYADCEALPAAKSAVTAKAPWTKAPPVISDRDRANGERALACAGMARHYEDIDNILATDLYGKSADYSPIIDHYRPDLTPAQKQSGIMKGQKDFAQMLVQDGVARRAAIMAGKPMTTEQNESVKFSKECARMSNVLKRVIGK